VVTSGPTGFPTSSCNQRSDIFADSSRWVLDDSFPDEWTISEPTGE
jgi:hypothetical protein